MILKKGQEKQLSKNLSQREVDCRCSEDSCTQTIIHDSVVDSFENLRISCGNKPLRITSAFRCQMHNKKIGGSDESMHKIGCALDVEICEDMPISEMAYRAKEFFETVIEYPKKQFIHCHNNIYKRG
jgi:uncharacterized protein YcbK (DUF882 family)